MQVELPEVRVHFNGQREFVIEGITWLVSSAGQIALSTALPGDASLRMAYGRRDGIDIVHVSTDPRPPGELHGGGVTYLGGFSDTAQIADPVIRGIVEAGLRVSDEIVARVLAERAAAKVR